MLCSNEQHPFLNKSKMTNDTNPTRSSEVIRDMRFTIIFLIVTLISVLALPITGMADTRSKDLAKATKRTAKATEVFREIMNTPDKGIPQYIMDRAECIAIFPSVLKVGFIFGGRGGTGLVSVRDPQTRQWQPPIFLRMGGGSFGAQIGAQSIDVVLIGMSRRSAELFTKGRFELGGELSATAGPVGRNAAASTDLPTFRSEILSYSRSRGLFVGAVIKGAVVKQDKDLNSAVYGQEKVGAFQPVSQRLPAGVMVFPETLNRYSTRRGV